MTNTRSTADRDGGQLTLLDAIGAYAAVLDPAGVVVAVSPRWAAAAAQGGPACPVAPGEDYLAACARGFDGGGDDSVRATVGLREVLRGDADRFQFDYPVGTGDAQRWFTMIVSPVDVDRSGHVVAHVDVTARKRIELDFALAARRDPLTGLPNRAALLTHLAGVLDRTDDRPGAPAVLLCDLDRFKQINDALGHGVGDDVLRACVPRLRSCVRPGDLVARFGEDEFVVVLDQVPDPGRAGAVGERLRAAFGEPLEVDGRELYVTVSIGIALGTGQTPEDLLRAGDAAMYEAKARGRARCEVFDEEMRSAWSDRMSVEQELRRAVDGRELLVHYQPIADVATGQLYGAEALLRWQHPRRGLVSPWPIIPMAEETGLILPIGELVMAEATRVAASLADYGTPLTVSVNLSGRQVSHPGLVDAIVRVLAESGADPSLLCFEITESAVMADPALALRVLHRLRELGLWLALDDFGTGYSSLAYLRDFPVDVLKIDQSFVRRLGQDPRDEAVVAAVVNLARGLGLRTVAEGVETEEQLARLRELGCDRVQGYLVGHAEPARSLRTLALRSAAGPLLPVQRRVVDLAAADTARLTAR